MRGRGWARTAGHVVFAAAVLAVVVAHVLILWDSVTVRPLWEDEAFNLTVPRNLVLGLGYTSDGVLSGSVPTPFDPRISTGPAVLLPVAGLLALGVDPVLAARLVPLAYSLVLLAGLWVLGRGIAGRWGALLAVAFPLTFNGLSTISPIQGPGDLLGEIAAASFLVWAMIALRRRVWLAGLLLGLAVSTKLVSLFAAPAFVCGVLVLLAGQSWRRRRAVVGVAALWTAAPLLAYELVAALSLGPAGYIAHLRKLGGFLLTSGDAFAAPAPADKIAALARTWFVPWQVVAATLVVMAALIVAVVVLRRSPATESPIGGFEPRDAQALLTVASVGAATFLVWWMLSTGTPAWVRHPAPAIFAFCPVLAAFAVRGVRMLWATGRPWARLVAVPVGALMAVVTGFAAWGHVTQPAPWQTLAEQRAIADDVHALGHEAYAVQWGPALSIAVLSGARVGAWQDGEVVAGLPRLTWSDKADRCGEVLLLTEHYLVCGDPLQP